MNLYLIGIEGDTRSGEHLVFKDFAVISNNVIDAENYVKKRFAVTKIRYAVKAHDGKYIVASTYLDTDVR